MRNMSKFLVSLVLCCLFLVSAENAHDISKRSFYLLFPRNTILQFTYGLTVPVVLPRRSINISWCYQAQYNLPYNISNFYPNTIAVRQNSFGFDLPRIKFYEYLAKLLSNFGLNGDHCVLRSICEIAEIPMYKKDDSLLERIVEYLFTPSLELNSNSSSKDLKDEYKPGFTQRLLSAEELGKSEGNCDEKYSKCIISLVDLMTVLYVT